MNFIKQYINDEFNAVLLGVFILTILIQLYYVLLIFRKLAFYKNKPKNISNSIPMSIIICARNESDKLFSNLPHILEQRYPNFEVIVVNHQSIDNSKEILDAFCQQYDNLRIVELHQDKHLRPGKKLPLTVGIKAAKNAHILLTDADCIPSSKLWIHHMASSSSANEIVLGYGPLIQKPGLLNKLLRFDTAWIGINYLSMALHKKPYMGVGRNLAYTQESFFTVNGFKSHYAIASGDDDLFIQEATRNKQNYTIQIEPESYMFSPAKETLTEWIKQKSRHYTTTPKYRFIKKLLLAIYPISLILAWISFVSLILQEVYPYHLGFIMVVFYAIKWFIQGKSLLQLQEKKFALFFPFWDMIYALIIPMIYVIAKNKKNATW
jgi:cellulose synthase/poly-beta-1,6-N-acetylglucosamine synthase-like glycosyltransferase